MAGFHSIQACYKSYKFWLFVLEQGQSQGGKELQKKSEESEYDALDKWSNEINRTQDILFANLC